MKHINMRSLDIPGPCPMQAVSTMQLPELQQPSLPSVSTGMSTEETIAKTFRDVVGHPPGPQLTGSAADGTKKPTRLLGTNRATKPLTDGTSVRGIPRRLTAFVGRLHKDTEEDELKEFLSEAGLKEVQVRKLQPPEGRVFYTAAFMVSCAGCCKDLFYNESTWPAGAEMRDWYFKSKGGNN